VLFSVGFIDITCPPGSVYAAYNLIRSNNLKIVHGPTSGHEGPSWNSAAFIRAYLGKRKQAN